MFALVIEVDKMSQMRYTEEPKREAVNQVVERDHSVAEVAKRLGTTTHSCTCESGGSGGLGLSRPNVQRAGESAVAPGVEAGHGRARHRAICEAPDLIRSARVNCARSQVNNGHNRSSGNNKVCRRFR